jgi:glycosyltransferase involved in cell wall biosynthesis
MTSDPDPWPLVSVIVPTVDRPELLARAVRSILAQDYPGEIECIVVFDGTEPRMPDVDVPPGRSVQTIVNTRTKGLAGNRNSGYLHAKGSYLGTCDDDDEWLPARVRKQIELLQRRPDASVSASGIVIRKGDHDYERRAIAQLSFDELLIDRYVEVTAFVFPRRLVDDGILVDETLPGGYAEDYDFVLRAARTGPVVNVPDPLAVIYWNDASYFVSRWRTIDDALVQLLEKFPEFENCPQGLARIEGQRAFANAALGNRRLALRLALQSLRRSRRPRQSWAALLVALHLISAERVVTTARRFGRGI